MKVIQRSKTEELLVESGTELRLRINAYLSIDAILHDMTDVLGAIDGLPRYVITAPTPNKTDEQRVVMSEFYTKDGDVYGFDNTRILSASCMVDDVRQPVFFKHGVLKVVKPVPPEADRTREIVVGDTFTAHYDNHDYSIAFHVTHVTEDCMTLYNKVYGPFSVIGSATYDLENPVSTCKAFTLDGKFKVG